MIVAVASAQRKKGRLAEPLDPVALNVASVLKSLRTRTGLQEERLHGTQLALDPLTRLDSIKELINTGESRERAIVRAVRAAAGTLEPTMGIVADVSLGLRLAVDQVTDADLYAQDLGQRREALLRNWIRLHELRSAPASAAPSLNALRLEVEFEALKALAVALTTSASTAQPTGGPVGTNEPRTSRVRSGAGPAAPTLLQTFQTVARALRRRLTKDAGGMPTGWQHNLRERAGEATAVSTAYGIRAMLLLEDGLAADLIPVTESLRKMALRDGGYASREQTESRAESTAVVLSALRRVAATDDFGGHIDRMESYLGDFEKSRPFILTTMLETSLLLGPKSGLVKVLVDSLLAARREYGDLQLWPEKSEKSEDGPIRTDPSVAHTARAVRVLADVQAIRPDSQVQEALDQAVAWLIERRDLYTAKEDIERQLPDGIESVLTSHFTAAWVVKALVSAGVPATHPSVSNAVTQIWNSYTEADDPDLVGASLWHADNGDLPIWMTFDAIEALRLASLAVQPDPAGDHRRDTGTP
jgi:hypothetical protein